MTARFSHVNQRGEAHMVDVGAKPVTRRVALAVGEITLNAEALGLLRANKLAKGDALAVEILDYVTDCLATAFASITYVLQPQAFIVGGGVAEEAALLFKLLRKNVDKRLSPHFAKLIEI